MLRLHVDIARCVAISLAIAAFGCSPSTAPEEYLPLLPPPATTTPVPDAPWPSQAWLDRTLNLSFYDEAELTEIANRPLLVIQLRLALSDEAQGPIAFLRAQNPDLVIVGILQVLSVPEIWGEPGHRARFPLSAHLYDLLSSKLARTTTGEIPLMWADAPMVNPYKRGGFDERLVAQVLDEVSRAAQQHPGAVDGIFHDYLSGNPFVFPGQGDVGEVDLDGDGVGARLDPEDRAAWVGYQRALVTGFQERFGPGLIQIGNGRLPHDDALIAAQLAGIAYENFPTTVWGYSDLEGMDLMLQHHEPGWLTPRRGRLWSLLWDRRGSDLDFCRAAAALSGQFYAKTDLQGFIGADAQHGSMGQPIGALTRTVHADQSVEFQRVLSNGIAVIETDPYGNSTRNELVPD